METRITLTGATGRMGHELIAATLQDERCSLVGATANSRKIGVDAGELIGELTANVAITNQIDEVLSYTDIIIDFSEPAYTIDILPKCQAKTIPLVIGTTGFDEKQYQFIQEAAQFMPIVLAPNTSTAVNIMCKLLQVVTKTIGQDCDIDIVDKHHRNKIDAPSGTALNMGKVIAKQLNIDLRQKAVYSRHGKNQPIRDRNTIGFSSIRAGGLHGEHTVSFVMDGEEINITHRAFNRQIYAVGAIRAALWLQNQQKPGLYSMADVLALV
ncbi:MAG: 4-hydroxy-tetrahydrodipicolinate reductase [Endozoicomonadaceae bacterium]|nr:4-hydroxy-tetrahydrodipicolinate reductase [Endozoicomonadaceae bacterium]MBE8232704.1 4-hydroxy-tetrahydrodipicolinate reductase [Endozoicomonadaceae bacterium]